MIPLSNFIRPSDLVPPNTTGPVATIEAPEPKRSPLDDLADGIKLIKLYEALELRAYPDPGTGGEPYTIGYGNTRHNDGTPVQLGDRVTKEQAEDMLQHQILDEFLPALEQIPGWSKMTHGMKGAMLSFAWNLGAGFVGNTELFPSINKALATDWGDVPRALMLYVKGAGGPMLGLKRRRCSEACLWDGLPVDEAYQAGQQLQD